MPAMGGGRVKRRSPTIIEQFTVAARDTAWRIFRILYPKSNRIACFRKGGDFSHGLGHEDAFPRPRLSGRCRFSQVTFARTRGNGRDAPKAGTRGHAAGLPGLASKAVVRVLQCDGSSTPLAEGGALAPDLIKRRTRSPPCGISRGSASGSARFPETCRPCGCS